MFLRSFVRLFICWFFRSLVRSFVPLLVRLFVRSFVCSLVVWLVGWFVCSFDRSFACSFFVVVTDLKQRRRQRQRKRHPKICLYFICATSRLFQLAQLLQNGELPRNQIGRSGVQVKKENKKFIVVRSRSPQNLKCGYFMLLFCRGRQRNVPKCKRHVQSDCLCSLNLLICGVVVAVAVVVCLSFLICIYKRKLLQIYILCWLT